MKLIETYIKEIQFFLIFLFIQMILFINPINAQNNTFSMEEIKGYPFPSDLTSSANTDRVVWAFNENGLRNLYVAEGPDYVTRKLTAYNTDGGQAFSSVKISADGNWVVYIRGGDFGSNWNDEGTVNPTFSPDPPKVQLWSIPFEGGKPILLGDGLSPSISPKSDVVAFVKSGQIWQINIDGSNKAEKLFNARGSNRSPTWSPDGSRLAFQSNRQDHSFIGIFTNKSIPIIWIDPSFNRDGSPRWSPDGESIVFTRQPGRGGMIKPMLEARHFPWEIRTTNIEKGTSKLIWKAPETVQGSMSSTQGRANLHWAAKGRIVFMSYEDGWPHLYSISENGEEAILLTPGDYMAEYIHLSADGKFLYFAGNTGDDPLDIDRRHIVGVPVDKAEPEVITQGNGLEWTPVITGKSGDLIYLSATPQRPPLPAIMNLKNKKTRLLAENLIPSDFPTEDLVIPSQVVFKSEDGWDIHGTLFEPKIMKDENPAIIYVHGGPPRQMLLGWHYSSYYSNAYAVNQYLASQGFVVLSVNYRLGIGYGYEFHRPVDGGTRGASEYKDVKAAALWLAKQSFIDKKKIGIYGGSYGGYLTAMALGRNSDLFAAGVDIHGVHDRTINRTANYMWPDKFEQAPDREKARQIAWESSPVSSVPTWTSPVMIIHADDDRNVQFSQSTDLVQRLKEKGVYTETMVIVDDTHHFMMHKNQLKVNKAIADFLNRFLK